MNRILHFSCLLFLLAALPRGVVAQLSTELLIVGGGASGSTAAIQASRMGVTTVLLEEGPWLGGMLTSAGVSAIDGNHRLPSGLWAEFRQKLYNHYGGPSAVETGWVSNTLFEPSYGDKVFKDLVRHAGAEVWYHTKFLSAVRNGKSWLVRVRKKNKVMSIRAKLIIDATELGDVMSSLNIPYRLGMDSRKDTGEEFAPPQANDIIQDMTYVAVLKDFGPKADKTIAKPKGYNPELFRGSCDVADPSSVAVTSKMDCQAMLNYGKLPNGKYMINWPKCGNDIYLNIVELTEADRKKELDKAKEHTLSFVYYLQTVLGFKNLGLADDEFPTRDHLPMLPYHRESRRLKGKVTLTLNEVRDPYNSSMALYRSGIAVGDYPIDHHHLKNPEAPEIEFVKIKVPSYNVPLGALVSENQDGIIIAEKSISVTNIVAGATRLQPVVLGVGQAAGALAAVCLKNNTSPAEVNIREVQQSLLDSKVYLMPFLDVTSESADFQSIQRVGCTGIMKGYGIAYKWANQTWFYPELPVSQFDLLAGLRGYYPLPEDVTGDGSLVTLDFLIKVLNVIKPEIKAVNVQQLVAGRKLSAVSAEGEVLDRATIAVVIDKLLQPFNHDIDFSGALRNELKSVNQ